METIITCEKCKQFNKRFRCNSPDECDCPKCQGYCQCSTWVQFTKRTNDPKLAWIEKALDVMGIPHRRNGESWHAPILEVPVDRLEDASTILNRRVGRYRLDDIRDDHPRWSLRS